MSLGRENDKLLKRAVEALEQGAEAQKQLIVLATEERAVGEAATPPFCPHCGAFDPTVSSGGGKGAMSTFILAGTCDNCGKVLFGVPESWQMFQSQRDVTEFIEGRAGVEA